jgi:hypothetical protein
LIACTPVDHFQASHRALAEVQNLDPRIWLSHLKCESIGHEGLDAPSETKVILDMIWANRASIKQALT